MIDKKVEQLAEAIRIIESIVEEVRPHTGGEGGCDCHQCVVYDRCCKWLVQYDIAFKEELDKVKNSKKNIQ